MPYDATGYYDDYGDASGYDNDYEIQTRTSRRAKATKAAEHEKRAETLMALAAREMELAEKAQRLLDSFGVFEDYPNETVLLWKRDFHTGGREYTYAALKVAGHWYLTTGTKKILTHEELIVEHLRHASEVWYVHEWERLV